MTDYKQLCADLADRLEISITSRRADANYHEDRDAIDHARAALAEPDPQRRCIYNPVQIAECGGPCEQGPEHCDCGELWVTEPGAPTDEELILTYAFAVTEAVNAMCKPLKPEEYKRAQLAGLRAVLARWGNHPGSPDRSGNLKAGLTRSPAAGEVAELVTLLRHEAREGDLDAMTFWQMCRAADLLEQLSPPQPVPVSERLPGPGDCDAEGECYWFDPEGSGAWYQDTYQGNYSHWLPAHALPQPS